MRCLKGLVGLLFGGLSLGACQKKNQAIPNFTYTGPLVETTNVVTLVSDSARLQMKLTAPLEQQFENGDIIYPKGMAVTFYDKPGLQVVNTLEAKYGKFDKAQNLYIMRGAVRVENQIKHEKMATEELFFSRAKQQIYTDSAMFVRVETPFEVLTGYGLTAAQDFSRYRIRRPAGVFTLETAPKP